MKRHTRLMTRARMAHAILRTEENGRYFDPETLYHFELQGTHTLRVTMPRERGNMEDAARREYFDLVDQLLLEWGWEYDYTRPLTATTKTWVCSAQP